MLSKEELHPTVQGHQYRVDANHWEELYVVGDVHGCFDAFRRLVREIDPDDRTLLVVVGDLVRKGPDSHRVVEFVRDSDNVVSVQGNNESKIVRGDASLPGLTAADRAYLESLPVVISWDGAMVVHGGVDPRRPLVEQSRRELQTFRSFTSDDEYERPYWFEEYDGDMRVFFGHTVLEEPYESESAVGLDTGCVYGGRLTAYHVGTGRKYSVQPAETYQGRSSDSIAVVRATVE